MKILGVVILYHPEDSVVANTETYINCIDKLILWDNTPAEESRQPDFGYEDKVIRLSEGRNRGIGYALNQAVAYAIENGYTHLLTMDQDSYFQLDDFRKYLSEIELYGADKQVIFSTNYFITSQQKPYHPVSNSVEDVASSMTSGSIYLVSLFQRLGYFREDLFVWGIDSEFSWRAKREGISTICFTHILLVHDLGYQRKKRKVLGKEVTPNEYSPVRSYYNVRNGIILYREYPDFVNIRSHLKYHLYKRIIFVLLYERSKKNKLKALYYGYIHGKKNKCGECTVKLN